MANVWRSDEWACISIDWVPNANRALDFFLHFFLTIPPTQVESYSLYRIWSNRFHWKTKKKKSQPLPWCRGTVEVEPRIVFHVVSRCVACWKSWNKKILEQESLKQTTSISGLKNTRKLHRTTTTAASKFLEFCFCIVTMSSIRNDFQFSISSFQINECKRILNVCRSKFLIKFFALDGGEDGGENGEILFT